MSAKRYTFEAYLACNGQINLFVLEGGELVALIGKWEADALEQFWPAAQAVVFDEEVWREWNYVDADVLGAHRLWRMVADGRQSAAQTLHDYYARCKALDKLCFRVYPERETYVLPVA